MDRRISPKWDIHLKDKKPCKEFLEYAKKRAEKKEKAKEDKNNGR